MINDILWIIALTLLPGLELRASIPYGLLFTDLSPVFVVLLAIVTNIIIGPLLYFFVGNIVQFLRRNNFFNRYYTRFLVRSQKKMHAAVEKWGYLGVAIFIGIPLPGTGVYTAALGSYVIGLDAKKFFLATVLGVLIAC